MAIARLLRAEGVPTAQGGQWWPATVRDILSQDERPDTAREQELRGA